MITRREVTQAEFEAFVVGAKRHLITICEPMCIGYYRELDSRGWVIDIALKQLVSDSSIPGPDRYFLLEHSNTKV